MAAPSSDAGRVSTPDSLSADLRCRIEFAAANDDFSGVGLVVRGGRAIFRGAFGYADRESGRQIETVTRFSLASAGKMFTTVAVGQLIESGRLSLDSRLGDLLPDYPNQDARQITVRQLLAHSAGLGTFFDRSGALGATFSTASEALALFAAQPLLFKPGSEASYSNEGYIVLGAIVERMAGTAYYDYVAQNIFQPASMANTGFATAADVGALPTGYAFADDDLFGLGARRPVPRSLIGRGYAGGPAGGAYSTADDMSAFMRALTEGRLLQRSTLETLLEVRPGAAEGHALGFQVKSVNGRTLFGHNGGSTAGAEVNIFAIWETGDSYVLMSNYAPPIGQPLSDDIASMLSVKVDE